MGENLTCLLSCEQRETKEQVEGKESLIRLQIAALKEIEDGRLLHTGWADVTDVSEESVC